MLKRLYLSRFEIYIQMISFVALFRKALQIIQNRTQTRTFSCVLKMIRLELLVLPGLGARATPRTSPGLLSTNTLKMM